MSEARRDHESVDRLVEAVLDGHAPEDAVAAAADRVRSLAGVAIPPEVRERHLALIRSGLADAPRSVVHAGPIRRRFTALTAGLATFLALGGGGAVAVAQNAEPGDVLYGLKRATERVRLAFAGDDEESVRVELAERRIAEAASTRGQRHVLLEDALDELIAATEDPDARAIAALASLLDAGLPDAAAERARDALADACERIAERREREPEACRSTDETATTAGTTDSADEARQRGRGGAPADEQGTKRVPSGEDTEGEAEGEDTGGEDTEDGDQPREVPPGPPDDVAERGRAGDRDG